LKLLFSKRKCGAWPNSKLVVETIKNYFEDLENGKDISKYDQSRPVKKRLGEASTSPKKSSPIKKSLSTTKVNGKV